MRDPAGIPMISLAALILLAFASWHDLRTREVPDWISLALAGVGGLAILLKQGENDWLGWFAGAALGGLLTAPFLALGGIGGADVKLMVGLGAIFGPGTLLLLAFLTAIVGGILAIAAKYRGRRDYAYCPALISAVALAVLLGWVVHGRIA